MAGNGKKVIWRFEFPYVLNFELDMLLTETIHI